jgi:hypothetical protein
MRKLFFTGVTALFVTTGLATLKAAGSEERASVSVTKMHERLGTKDTLDDISDRDLMEFSTLHGTPNEKRKIKRLLAERSQKEAEDAQENLAKAKREADARKKAADDALLKKAEDQARQRARKNPEQEAEESLQRSKEQHKTAMRQYVFDDVKTSANQRNIRQSVEASARGEF